MVRIWDNALNVWRDAKKIRRRNSSGVLVDTQAVYATMGGGKRQVWPERLYLIRDGKITAAGGYKAYAYSDSVTSGSINSGSIIPDIKQSVGSFDITMRRVSDKKHGSGTVFFNSSIDLSKYNTLSARLKDRVAIPGGAGWVKLITTAAIKESYNMAVSNYFGIDAPVDILTVDISGLSGSYYIGIEMCVADSQVTGRTEKIVDVWLEA